MVALPDSFIQELISRNDIESVVSSYVRMKRRGRNLVGLCPFMAKRPLPSPSIPIRSPSTALDAARAATSLPLSSVWKTWIISTRCVFWPIGPG